MVSALSLRLHAASSTASAATSTTTGFSVSRSTGASTHGYSGDNESVSPKTKNKKVPSKINMGHATTSKREAPTRKPEVSGKKQKLLERDYAAYTVKSDLSRGDIPYPLLRKQPRLLSREGLSLDMSSVSIVSAEDVKASPFLLPANYASYFENDFWHTTIASMVSSTSGMYQKTSSTVAVTATTTKSERSGTQSDRQSEDADSTTSSMSDSEGDDANRVSCNNNDSETGGKTEAKKSKTQVINMGNALAISNQARLVVLGFAPFSVVHVNAAYSRMTGVHSTTALGQPLHELILDDIVAAALQSDCKNFSLNSLHLQSIKMSATKDLPTCVVRVSPVGSDAASVTHFVIELENANEDTNQTMDSGPRDLSIGVIG